MAIRLTKGIGNETKKCKGERKREVKEISNVISRISSLHFRKQVTATIMISPVSQCSKMLRQNKIRYGRLIRRPLKLSQFAADIVNHVSLPVKVPKLQHQLRSAIIFSVSHSFEYYH